MLTWQQLRDLNLGQLDDAADGWGEVSNAADAARDRVDAEMIGKVAKSQEGEAAKASVKRLKVLSQNFAYLHAECGLIRGTVNSLAHELRTPQRNLKQALEEAAQRQFTLDQKGNVSYPAAGQSQLDGSKVPGGQVAGRLTPLDRRPSPDGALLTESDTSQFSNPNPNYALAADIADRIVLAVHEANEIDARFSKTLSKLKAKPGLTVDSATWADAARDAAAVRGVAGDYLKEDIPTDKSPAARKEWWDRLSDEQREQYLTVYPDVIGNLDGIPAVVRDEANRNNLPLLIGKLEGQHDEQARTMLAGLRSIDSQLKAGSEPPMLLLGISDEGNGRAIVSYGNPDASRNVSAYVPGLGTALDEDFARNDLKRARDTAIGAREYDESSASIVWLGYDAPQLPAQEFSRNLDVMSPFDAQVGSFAYNDFMAGIGATNEHADPHITAIGHSYGSLTVGQAAQHEGGIPAADDIILVGSPGTGADKAEDLNVGKNHVFVGAADNDVVTKLPSQEQKHAGFQALVQGTTNARSLGPLALVFGGAQAWAVGAAADPDGSQLWFGTDPAHKDFGAQRFLTDDGPTLGEGGVEAHSNYFNPAKDQVSADNIAKIVSGSSDKIIMETGR
ncbi:hypothetical protein I2W78_18565 [Streptomyces spinoverrucosus]|uniref:alpha/beta hydrolase n=1 Tax=Streptomyces spinoverrucosus TaxID=284043 RepID=UPI0018C36502|nr:alpha/beta hydrolase [Streptomyces spinoverrucosus]MBG0853796.1 hypothetical protein [Streptomyces spinoverrucosus]